MERVLVWVAAHIVLGLRRPSSLFGGTGFIGDGNIEWQGGGLGEDILACDDGRSPYRHSRVDPLRRIFPPAQSCFRPRRGDRMDMVSARSDRSYQATSVLEKVRVRSPLPTGYAAINTLLWSATRIPV